MRKAQRPYNCAFFPHRRNDKFFLLKLDRRRSRRPGPGRPSVAGLPGLAEQLTQGDQQLGLGERVREGSAVIAVIDEGAMEHVHVAVIGPDAVASVADRQVLDRDVGTVRINPEYVGGSVGGFSGLDDHIVLAGSRDGQALVVEGNRLGIGACIEVDLISISGSVDSRLERGMIGSLGGVVNGVRLGG